MKEAVAVDRVHQAAATNGRYFRIGDPDAVPSTTVARRLLAGSREIRAHVGRDA